MGVNFTAINALEKRTREQAKENKALQAEIHAEVDALRAENEAMKAKLVEIELLLNTKK